MKRTDLDLASRALGGSVRIVSDEFFAPCEALIQPWSPLHDTLEFGPHGKIYDGWETRRRRTPGYDWAIVALGVPGVLHQIIVDTAFFTGNYPPEVSLEATWVDGNPSNDELAAADWVSVVPQSAARGDTANAYRVHNHWAFTHVRLNIFPDGGVARLRVLGTPVPDPRVLSSRTDLAALHNGGEIAECSDMFYSDARQVLYPVSPGPCRRVGRPPVAGPRATTTWWSPWPARPGCPTSTSTPGTSSGMRRDAFGCPAVAKRAIPGGKSCRRRRSRPTGTTGSG